MGWVLEDITAVEFSFSKAWSEPWMTKFSHYLHKGVTWGSCHANEKLCSRYGGSARFFRGHQHSSLQSMPRGVSFFLNSRAHTHKQPVWWLFYFIDEYQSLSRGKKLLSPFFSAGVNFINCDKVFNKQTLT